MGSHGDLYGLYVISLWTHSKTSWQPFFVFKKDRVLPGGGGPHL